MIHYYNWFSDIIVYWYQSKNKNCNVVFKLVKKSIKYRKNIESLKYLINWFKYSFFKSPSKWQPPPTILLKLQKRVETINQHYFCTDQFCGEKNVVIKNILSGVKTSKSCFYRSSISKNDWVQTAAHIKVLKIKIQYYIFLRIFVCNWWLCNLFFSFDGQVLYTHHLN